MPARHPVPPSGLPPLAGDDAFRLDQAEVLSRLASSSRGLTGEEARLRLRRLGPNELPRPRPPHPLRLLVDQDA